jgi:3-oxoacyl-[acyl-carrier protein] reductase
MLKNKNAIITGSSRGIGKKTVEIFSEYGANVWACCRKKDVDFEEFSKMLSIKNDAFINILYFDITKEDEIKDAIKEINNSKNNIDILVNNAGITLNSLFQMTTLDQWKNIFEVNLFSVVRLTQYVLKFMIRQNSGSIISIASTAGIDGNLGKSAYGSTKSSIICITKSLAKEVSGKGIRVNAIAPGLIMTDMLSSMSNEIIKNTLEDVSLKRVGNPQEISEVIAFLASEKSSYINGQIIRVDGGMYL